jgi:predicted unusual protein kinase regulating ubiquinone biosynthesis (AarF/ABC1/UbiB family)
VNIMARQRQITTTRLGRLTHFGRLAGGLISGAVTEGTRQIVSGRRPSIGDVVLTPANARRMTQKLSEMRGAAMKVGQLLSMDNGQLISPEFSEILSRLRDDAHHMPLGQVAEVLGAAWGENWDDQFERFVFTPLAAASIGQVHEAVLNDGRRVAVKVQYPGIRDSIDSDIDNVAGLLRMFKLLPAESDIDSLLDEAKIQLHLEADYLREAGALKQFRQRVAGDDRYATPEVLDDLTTHDVLTMSYLDGMPIEWLEDRAEDERNLAAASLLELCLREIFEWGLVQTDPNFANYRYQPKSGTIELMDFGATRVYTTEQQASMRKLLQACVDGSGIDVADAAVAVGYLNGNDTPGYRDSIIKLLTTAIEPVRSREDYDFGKSDLASRMSDIVLDMRLKKRVGQMPPVSILFLHRKIGGLYLLLSRLKSRLPVRELVSYADIVPA